jgi:hypothetical protein
MYDASFEETQGQQAATQQQEQVTQDTAMHSAGGRGEFNWDNVKADKDREFYLGHSVKALTGRWQKGGGAAAVAAAIAGWCVWRDC